MVFLWLAWFSYGFPIPCIVVVSPTTPSTNINDASTVQGSFQPRGRRAFTRAGVFAHGAGAASTCSMNKYCGYLYMCT